MTPKLARLSTLLCDELTYRLQKGGVPNLPAGGALLWSWFMDLNKSRTFHMNGPNHIGFSQIEAYGRLRRLEFQPHHLSILLAMDGAYLDYVAKITKPLPEGVTPMERRSDHAMNAGLFDAIFG